MRLPRRQRIRSESRLLDEGRQAHLRKGIEAVVARSPVRANADAATGRQHFGNRGDATAELEIRARAVDYVRPLPREHSDVVLVDPDAVRQGGARPRDPDRIEIRALIVAGLAL